MKKLLATVLGVMLVLSLTGCGEEPILISDTDEPIVWDLEDVDEVEKPADTAATRLTAPYGHSAGRTVWLPWPGRRTRRG